MLEDPWVDEDAACRSLLRDPGRRPRRTSAGLTPATCSSCSASTATSPSSIAGALAAARENARGARETISRRDVGGLNTTWHALPSRRLAAERLGPALFFGWVRERAAVLAGLADVHDEPRRRLAVPGAGRSLERADMTARLLSIQR